MLLAAASRMEVVKAAAFAGPAVLPVSKGPQSQFRYCFMV